MYTFPAMQLFFVHKASKIKSTFTNMNVCAHVSRLHKSGYTSIMRYYILLFLCICVWLKPTLWYGQQSSSVVDTKALSFEQPV